MPKTEAEKLGAEMGLALNMATRFGVFYWRPRRKVGATLAGLWWAACGFHRRNRRAKIIKEEAVASGVRGKATL